MLLASIIIIIIHIQSWKSSTLKMSKRNYISRQVIKGESYQSEGTRREPVAPA
jgi:hypothetical protein